MNITLTFTPEEFKEHQDILERGRAYDKVVKQRDEVDYKFKALQDAIDDAGFGITIIWGGRSGREEFSIHKMDAKTKAFYKEHPQYKHYLRSYQD